LLHKT